MGEMIFVIKEKITDNEYLALYNKLRDVKELLGCEVAPFWDPPPEQSEARMTAAIQDLVRASGTPPGMVPTMLPYVSASQMSHHFSDDEDWENAEYDPRRAHWDDEDLILLSPEELVSAGPRFRGGPQYDAPRLRDLLRYDTLPVATDQVRLRELLAETQSVSRDTDLMRETEAYLRRRHQIRNREPSDADSDDLVAALRALDEPAV